MSSEVGSLPLRELSSRITKGTTPTKGEGFVDCGINYIKSESISADGSIDESKFAFIDLETHNKLSRSQLRPGNVLFSMAGVYLGKTAVVLSKHLPANTNQAVGIVTLDESKADPYFIHYSLQSPACRAWILRSAAQSAQPNFNLQEIGDLKIPEFPLARQKEIASVLRLLDDRITLLRETNTTLEAIAQALFKSWFVDFDPVHAKMQGRAPEGMDEATAALFPDSFEESELGTVPKGWSAAEISEVVEGVYDGPHATPPEAVEGGVFLGIKNLTGTALELTEVRHIAESDWAQWTKRVTPQVGDMVFSYEATLGFFALIPPNVRCCLGRRLALIRPKSVNGAPHFWFHQFIAQPFQRLLTKHTIQGATVNRIALKEFPSYEVLSPPLALQLVFERVVQPLWARVHQNSAQVQVLASLRDTLLPRLISGQLQLPEAGQLEAALT